MIWSEHFQPIEFLRATRFAMLPKEYSPIVVERCNIKPYSKVLDVGCGTGCFAKFLSASTFNVEYTGIDKDRNFINNAERLEVTNTFKLFEGNAYELPFENESFDTVVSHTFFNCIEFPRIAIDEMKRVLKKGGVIGTVTSISNQRMLKYKGNYPDNCEWVDRLNSIERDFIIALEKIGMGPSTINKGLQTEGIPCFFAENNLRDISVLPIAYAFSLSDIKFTLQEKEFYIKNIYIGDCERVDGAMSVQDFKMLFSKEMANEYKELLKKRYMFWESNLSDNKVWDWMSGTSILVTGKKD